MHAVPPIIWSCLRAVPSWTCRLYGRGLCVYVVYYLPAPYFLSQLECSLLEHEFEEETCGRDVGVYLCERATATNGGDDNDGQKVRWTWHLSIRSSIETSGGSKIFFHLWWRVLWSLRLIYVTKSGVEFDYDTGGSETMCEPGRCESCPGPGLVLVLFFECCEFGVNKGATCPAGTKWKVSLQLGSMDGPSTDLLHRDL